MYIVIAKTSNKQNFSFQINNFPFISTKTCEKCGFITKTKKFGYVTIYISYKTGGNL